MKSIIRTLLLGCAAACALFSCNSSVSGVGDFSSDETQWIINSFAESSKIENENIKDVKVLSDWGTYQENLRVCIVYYLPNGANVAAVVKTVRINDRRICDFPYPCYYLRVCKLYEFNKGIRTAWDEGLLSDNDLTVIHNKAVQDGYYYG